MPTEPAGCLLGFLANLLGYRPTSPAASPPKVLLNKFFPTDAERAFFLILRPIVGTRGHILAQVSLRQLLYFPSAENRQTWLNRASQRSLDFVICHPQTLRPLLAIELDDSSHQRPDRQTRDDQVETLLTAAALPFLRIPAARSYNIPQLSAAILPHLAS